MMILKMLIMKDGQIKNYRNK